MIVQIAKSPQIWYFFWPDSSLSRHVNAASLKSLLEIQGTVSQKENSFEVKIVWILIFSTY